MIEYPITIGDRKLESIPTRFGYGDGLVELGKRNPNVVVLGADLTSSTAADRFQKAFPDRFFSFGIAEQNMSAAAGGLSLVGKIPFVSTYGVFSTGRAWDQLRTTICYSNLNVKVGGAHGGVSVGPDGATHQTLEDLSVTRCLPNLTVVSPCDYYETKKATIAIGEKQGPCYIRFGREPMPVFTDEKTPFVLGEVTMFRQGKDCTIIATGHMVHRALVAAEKLEKEGLSVRVVNLHTIKPIDVKGIIACAKETGCIVTAEEHQMMGGMGSAVAEVVVQNLAVPMEIIGIRDRFGLSGDPEKLMEYFGLGVSHLMDAVRRVIDRKKKGGK
jgi:transketolase